MNTRKTFLYAWELGSYLGHLGTFAPFAVALQAQGHAVRFAVRETAQCSRLLPNGSSWFQAPIAVERMATSPPLNYGDILLRFGYDDVDTLCGLLTGWRSILQAVRPDLLIADHSPSAMLAARSLGIPVMLFGAGFNCPPRRDPFPSMRFWEPVAADVLKKIDATALATINRAMQLTGTEGLAKLSDLFDVTEDTLLGVPELDHYPDRGPARYWGAQGVFHGTTFCPEWESDDRPRIFGYMRPDHPHLAKMLADLHDQDYQVLLCIPGWDGRHALGPGIRVVADLVDLAAVSAGVSLAIVYGSSTISYLLSCGIPVLCVPIQLENYLLALRVAALGAGAMLNPDAAEIDFAAVVATLLADPHFRTIAKRFADRYAALTHDVIIGNVVRRAVDIASLNRGESM
jgi:UDP:flavonoid glycosyltransferase YjiC (YdhE family)